jgi:hypothetical protein
MTLKMLGHINSPYVLSVCTSRKLRMQLRKHTRTMLSVTE